MKLGSIPLTTAPVVSQVSRPARQGRLRQFLQSCDIVPFASEEAHNVGGLLAEAGSSDIVDAHLALTGAGAEIVTSDPGDLRALADVVFPHPVIRRI